MHEFTVRSVSPVEESIPDIIGETVNSAEKVLKKELELFEIKLVQIGARTVLTIGALFGILAATVVFVSLAFVQGLQAAGLPTWASSAVTALALGMILTGFVLRWKKIWKQI